MAKRTWGEPRDQRREASAETGGEAAEERQQLWLIAVSPSVWLAHFLACYLTAAVWCAKASDVAAPLGGVRWAVAAYTALALLGIAGTGWLGYRRAHFGTGALLHHRDTAQDRHRFLGFAALLLSGLSAVAVLYVALPALFIASCQ
jgi:hypothetical protein